MKDQKVLKYFSSALFPTFVVFLVYQWPSDILVKNFATPKYILGKFKSTMEFQIF